jgi:AGZA family xanthine/uracil permease-like MFS transporter
MRSITGARTALDVYFGLSARRTTWRREATAGLTTFATMAYILFLHPAVLGAAVRIDGVDLRPQLLTATALAAALGSLLLGVLGRYPVAAAPAMGLNAYFAHTIVLGDGVPWQTALGAVFLGGCIGLLFSFSVLRTMMLAAFPPTLRLATVAGIGAFMGALGLQSAGIIGHGEPVPAPGDPFTIAGLVTASGLALLLLLRHLRVPGGILLAIGLLSGACIVTGAPVFEGAPFAGLPAPALQLPVWPKDLVFALDIRGVFEGGLITVVAAVAFVDLFDSVGALMGLADKAGLLDAEGNLPRAGQVLAADAGASVVGAVLGMSPTTSFVESAAGIDAGGRTGVTALVVALLFGASLFLWPLAAAIPAVALAPLLLYLGGQMVGAVRGVDARDPSHAVPAAVTIAVMPLTMSITNGIVAGVLTYCAWQWAYRGFRRVHWALNTVAAALIARMLMLAAAAL